MKVSTKSPQARYERLRAFYYAELRKLGFHDIEARVPYDGWTFQSSKSDKTDGVSDKAYRRTGDHISLEDIFNTRPREHRNRNPRYGKDNSPGSNVNDGAFGMLADSPDAQYWRACEHAAHALPDDYPRKAFLVAVSQSGYIVDSGRPLGISRDKAIYTWEKFVKQFVGL